MTFIHESRMKIIFQVMCQWTAVWNYVPKNWAENDSFCVIKWHKKFSIPIFVNNIPVTAFNDTGYLNSNEIIKTDGALQT